MLVADEDLDAANGAILSAQTLTNVAGVALGGALVGLTSTNDVLMLNAVTFVVSGARAAGVQPRAAPRAASRRTRSSAAAEPGSRAASSARAAACARRSCGWSCSACRSPRSRLGIVIAAAVPTLRDTYGASNLQIGGIMALDAIGIAIGTALPVALRRLPHRHRLARDRLGRLRHRADLWLAGPLSIVGGIGNGIVIVRFRTMMQRETPPHERASTIGFAYAVTFSMIVAGQIAVVPLSNVVGQRATFTVAGTIFAVGGLIAALCWPRAVKATETALLEASERSPAHAR